MRHYTYYTPVNLYQVGDRFGDGIVTAIYRSGLGWVLFITRER